MPLYKTSKADLKGKYKRNIELGLIITLLLLIAAFKFSPQKGEVKNITEPDQDIIKFVNAEHTFQKSKPPEKDKPVVPEVSLNDDIIDIEFETTEIDIKENLDRPPDRYKEKVIENENKIFIAVQEPPQPVGGFAAIQHKIQYTELARRIGIEGRVVVEVVVDENGDVIDSKILKSLFPSLDEVALNAVESTKFYPGKQRGKPVKVRITIPVTFRLQ